MRTVTAAVVICLAAAACTRDAPPGRAVSGKDAARLLIDRNWLDSWPQDKNDHLDVYRFVPSMGGGVFQDRTVFKGTFELFQFEAGADTIGFRFPHTGEQVKSRYRIERVDGPAPFDLKLTVTPDPRGPGVYHGITADQGGQDVEALVTRYAKERE